MGGAARSPVPKRSSFCTAGFRRQNPVARKLAGGTAGLQQAGAAADVIRIRENRFPAEASARTVHPRSAGRRKKNVKLDVRHDPVRRGTPLWHDQGKDRPNGRARPRARPCHPQPHRRAVRGRGRAGLVMGARAHPRARVSDSEHQPLVSDRTPPGHDLARLVLIAKTEAQARQAGKEAC